MKILLIILILTFTIVSAQQEQSWVDYLQNNRNTSTKYIEDNFDISTNPKWIKHYERWKWQNQFQLDNNGKLISKNYTISQYKTTKSINNNGNWAPIGPFSWTNGDTGYNPGNGRINAITVDPTNSNIIYACAASGGVWKSNDAGQTWNTTTDNLIVLGTSDIAINPLNTNILYLATGDRDGLDTYGVGVLKSADAGATWQPTGLYNEQPSASLIINCLAINPENPNIIFAGTNSGLFRTEDSGDNWDEIINYGNFKQVKFNLNNPNTVYATDANSFFRSYNNGLSFTEITEGMPTSSSRIVMDVTAADSNYIYLLVAGQSSKFKGVFQSVDGGSSFTKKVGIDEINLLGYNMDGADEATQAWYDLAIAVSPINPLEIYTGGINVWKSTNGGSDWEISTHWYYSQPNNYSHADIHSLDFYNNKLYCGSDGGAFVKNNNDIWNNISSGLNITQIYKFSNSDISTDMISIGAQDNGSNVLKNNIWKHVMGADGMNTIIDYNLPSICYASYQYGNILKSTNNGESMLQIFAPDDYDESSGWVTPYVLSKANSNTMYVGCENIYKTTNGGGTWESTTDLYGVEFRVMAISQSNENYVYAYNGSSFIKTNNGGVSWNSINIPNGGSITDIEISNNNPELVYLSLSSGSSARIYKSTDACENYTEITNGLPPIAVNCLTLENNQENGIYLGMELGVLYTNDDLDEWVEFSEYLPNVKITDIQVVNSINKVRIASYGRGVWESETYNILTSIKKEHQNNSFAIYPNPTNILININAKEYNSIHIYNSAGVLLKTINNTSETIKFNTQNLVAGFYFIKAIKSNGEYTTKRFVKN